MQTPPVETAGGCILVEGELIMQRAEEIRPLLLASLPTDGTVARLDLSQVSEIDAAGLQLLMAATREALSRGTTLQIVAASQVVRETFQLFRLDALLVPAEAAEARP